MLVVSRSLRANLIHQSIALRLVDTLNCNIFNGLFSPPFVYNRVFASPDLFVNVIVVQRALIARHAIMHKSFRPHVRFHLRNILRKKTMSSLPPTIGGDLQKPAMPPTIGEQRVSPRPSFQSVYVPPPAGPPSYDGPPQQQAQGIGKQTQKLLFFLNSCDSD